MGFWLRPTGAAGASLDSPTFTGDPKAPTPAAADNDTSVATTAFVQGEIAAKAPLASPTFTGTPSLPTGTTGTTQSAADGSTKLATTAYADRIAGGVGSPNTQTVDYTAVLADAGKTVEINSASAKIFTIPTNASVAFPTGTVIEICRLGAGSVTIHPISGVTIPNRVQAAGTSDRTIASQYSVATIRKRATDEWVLVGDIA